MGKIQKNESVSSLNNRRFDLFLKHYNLKISTEDMIKKYRLKTVCLYEESLEVCKKLKEEHDVFIISNVTYEIQASLLKESGL